MTKYHNLIDVTIHSVIVTGITIFSSFLSSIIFTILIFQEDTNQLISMLSKYEKL
jgi:hypothetical protein